jgi:hypothetical protein
LILKTSKVTLKTPIATNAQIGPYTLEAKVDTPNHLKATVKPQPVSGTIEKAGCKFKYTADIAFKVDVTLHPTPKKVPKTQKDTAFREIEAYRETTNQSSTNDELVKLGIAGTIMVVVYLLLTKGMPPNMVRVGNSMSPALRMRYMCTLEPPKA